ncbi:hypothetical protein TraAM80_09638, partial [Trypanosoma rangeli]
SLSHNMASLSHVTGSIKLGMASLSLSLSLNMASLSQVTGSIKLGMASLSLSLSLNMASLSQVTGSIKLGMGSPSQVMGSPISQVTDKHHLVMPYPLPIHRPSLLRHRTLITPRRQVMVRFSTGRVRTNGRQVCSVRRVKSHVFA